MKSTTSFNISDLNISGPLVLAPMAGVSCPSFRSLCCKFGVNLTYSSMIDVDLIDTIGLNRIEDIYLSPFDNEKIFIAQIIGGIPSINNLIKLVKFLDGLKYVDAIDFNIGCPESDILNKKAGSYLMQQLGQLERIINIIKENTTKPITVKMRLGFKENNSLDVLKLLESLDIKAIAVHGRLKKDMYTGVADLDSIKKLKSVSKIPIIVSGDIMTPGAARFALEKTGADGVMFARGVKGNPDLIARTKYLLDNGKNRDEMSFKEKLSKVIFPFLKLYSQQVNFSKSELSQQLKWFYKGFLRKDYFVRKYMIYIEHLNDKSYLNDFKIDFGKIL